MVKCHLELPLPYMSFSFVLVAAVIFISGDAMISNINRSKTFCFRLAKVSGCYGVKRNECGILVIRVEIWELTIACPMPLCGHSDHAFFM